MSGVQADISPEVATRQQDISSWAEGDITGLSSRAKKRYNKRKAAIKDYFTSTESIDEIALRRHIPRERLLQLAKQCLMLHEDGNPWGFRALVPGVTVVDHSPAVPSAGDSPSDSPEEEVMEPRGETGESAGSEIDTVLPGDQAVEDGEDTTKRQAISISSDNTSLEIPSSESTNIEKEEIAVEDRADEAVEAQCIMSTEDRPDQEEETYSEASAAYAEVPSPGLVSDKAERQLVVQQPMVPTALPLYAKQGYGTPVRKLAQTRRSIHRRWIRQSRNQRRQRRFRVLMSGVVVAAMLIGLLVPIGTALAAYGTYNTIRGVALDGVNHLLDVKSLFPASKSDLLGALNAPKLEQAQSDFRKAESDFLQLQQLVTRPDIQSAIRQFAPEYGSKLGMAQRLVRVGLDISRMGSELSGVALLGASIIHGSPLANGSTKPLITANDIANIEAAIVHGLYYISDIRAQMSQVALSEIPISDAQKKQLTTALALLPKAQDMLQQGQGLVDIVAWLLGVGQKRRFLVQTMDRAELRPSGGFTGQYGVLEIQDGRLAPFSLRDVTELDYAGNGVELGRQAPPEYRSWMTFGFWGLRDANLSGDYPTSARLAMQVFQEEGGGPVDGDISFTPVLIEHILDVIGPIKVPGYNEVITAQNLEDKLHYYQQNYSAIQIQRQKTGTNNAATRKTFTNLLGKILLDRVRHLQVKQLMAVAQLAVKDIQSRDLEIYFTNPLAEAWLVQHDFSGAMDTFTRYDGFMVVQSNISISKASQYVHTTEQDNVVLDAHGGATHNLTITLDYKPTGPVYGYDTYADYIRVYAPADAQLLGGDGFDSGKPLCTPKQPTSGSGGSPTPGKTGGPPPDTGCGQYNTYFPDSGRYCPGGNYSLGQRGYVPGKGFTSWPIDSLGGPTGLSSDLPGRAMWGGLTVTPKNCISTITLSWYVPNVVKHIHGHPPYALLVQKQGGYVPGVQITIDTSAINGLKPLSFMGDLIADRLFSLAPLK